jgi:hypothetical protein
MHQGQADQISRYSNQPHQANDQQNLAEQRLPPGQHYTSKVQSIYGQGFKHHVTRNIWDFSPKPGEVHAGKPSMVINTTLVGPLAPLANSKPE